MQPISRTPVYNLSAVCKETGLQADVLRAWERRYNLPQPQRTEGGHRIYSSYDVAVIQWLQARQAEGLRVSQAAALWNEITETGRDPFLEYRKAAVQATRPEAFESTQIENLQQRWMQACQEFNTLEAENVLNQAFAMYPLETVVIEILQKGIRETGSLWHQHKVTVQQEHFATALASRRIEALITAVPNPTRNQTLLMGCPAGERHDFPVLLLSLLLRRRGLHVVYLGADNPLEQMAQTAAAIQPTLTILAAQQLNTAAALRSTAVLFQNQNFPLAYGGLIFNRIPALRTSIPAFFLGEDLDEALIKVEQLILSPAVYPKLSNDDCECQKTAVLFRTKLPLIEAGLLEGLTSEGLSIEQLSAVNSFFSSGLAAALELGSPEYLEPDLEWVGKLLTDREISTDILMVYLRTYQHAVDLAMEEKGTLITGWIDSVVTKRNTDN